MTHNTIATLSFDSYTQDFVLPLEALIARLMGATLVSLDKHEHSCSVKYTYTYDFRDSSAYQAYRAFIANEFSTLQDSYNQALYWKYRGLLKSLKAFSLYVKDPHTTLRLIKVVTKFIQDKVQ